MKVFLNLEKFGLSYYRVDIFLVYKVVCILVYGYFWKFYNFYIDYNVNESFYFVFGNRILFFFMFVWFICCLLVMVFVCFCNKYVLYFISKYLIKKCICFGIS